MANENLLARLWNRFIGYRLGHGAYMSSMEVPPEWNYEQYLAAYGQVGWLFGTVSLISSSVAEVPWKLNRTKGGKTEEVDDHPILDMWAYVNPFQTKYQFVELLQMYLCLVGEAFIILNFNRRNQPAEMWLAPPQFMHIKPSAETYIEKYIYRRGAATMDLEIPEVIHIMSPNPLNPYRGLGAAQSIGVDLDSERYAARYNQRVFFNDATPAMLIEYPELPPPSERKDIIAGWNKQYRGWANARKTGFLWGGAKANMVTMSNKDMDYWRLRKLTPDIVLGAYHVPKSIMGMAEVGSRARAEADEYIYSKRVVKPNCQRICEALNEQLVPLFGDDSLAMGYENPVPQNREAMVTEAKELTPAGVITREEAREMLGYDADPKGTFLVPMNLLELPAKDISGNGTGTVTKEVDVKELAWRKYVIRNDEYEKRFMADFRKVWYGQLATVLDNLKIGATSLEAILFDEDVEADLFAKGLEPVMTETFTAAAEATQREIDEKKCAAVSARTGVHIPNVYGAYTKQEGVLSQAALEWLSTESLQMAKMVNATSIRELRDVLAAEFEEGHSVPKIEKAIRKYYHNGYEKRARLVARTEIIAASNEGSLQTYEANNILQSEFYAALDERTCEDCMDYHGRVLPTSECHGLIPVHPSCRCTWVAVV